MSEMHENDLSHGELHEMGGCAGLGGCADCDVETAAHMKAALKAQGKTACAICDKPILASEKYCIHCEFKIEQLHNERLYDRVNAADFERERYK